MSFKMRRLAITVFVALTVSAGPGSAQEPEAVVDDIVVTARRSGAPIWEVTRDGATVLLVGEITGVPEATPWSSAALEAATARSQRVIADTRIRASFSDVFRLIWRMRTLMRLPDGTTSADYLQPEWQARLDAVEARIDEDYTERSFLMTAGALLRDGAGYGRDTTDDAGEVVRRSARGARVPVRAIETDARGDRMIEDLLNAPPQTRLVCMHAAIQAAEAGPEAVLARGRAWTRFQVAEVMASPIQQALEQCWPWGDPELGPQLKTAWTAAIETALTETGVTMAVAPLGVLAEPGGVLDRLEAQGATIEGPEWKLRDGDAAGA